MFDILLRVLCFLLGAATVYVTLLSAIRTFVLPRSENVFLTRMVHAAVYRLFLLRASRLTTYEARDRFMAYYAPIVLLLLPVVSVFYVMLGYTFMYRAVGVESWEQAFTISGSSLLTLGTVPFTSFPVTLLEFTEAAIGLGLVALLIAYLPTIYSAFSARETAVTLLDVRAGSPPSAVELLARAHRIRGLGALREFWPTWEHWFAEIEESHTSLSALVMLRSPQAERSWVTAAGTVLDAAALYSAVVDAPADPGAQLCLRAGYLALHRIAEFFDFEFNHHPHFPADAISISRAEFDEACAQLTAAGVPLKADRDQAWQDYGGWRVNYDRPLLFIARLTMAPYAPWVSDRSLPRPHAT
jgi:hypothetical protein